MKILITGSEGVLGSTLKKELRRRGHDVFGCDLAHSADPQVMRADISEHRQLARVFDWANPELVYDFAAEFGRANGTNYPEQTWKSNCLGTQNVISECIRTNSILAFASSSEAYGMADDYAPENQDFQEGWLDKYAPQFHNVYALTKWVNERQIFMAARNEGLKSVVFRFFNAYGPGEHYSPYRSVVCLFTYRLLKSLPITIYKNYFRTHMFINDWCQTVANLSTHEYLEPIMRKSEYGIWEGSGRSRVPVFNIGGEEYESVEALAMKILKHIGGSSSKISFLDAEKANVISKKPDNTLARMWLDHNPTTILDDGLPPTIEWLCETYGLR